MLRPLGRNCRSLKKVVSNLGSLFPSPIVLSFISYRHLAILYVNLFSISCLSSFHSFGYLFHHVALFVFYLILGYY